MGVSQFTYDRPIPRLTILMVGSDRPIRPWSSIRGEQGNERAKTVPLLSRARPRIIQRRRFLPRCADAEIFQERSSARRDRDKRRDRRCRDNRDRHGYPFGEHALAAAVRASSSAISQGCLSHRHQAEAAVGVAGDLVDEIDLLGEVFAHMALALGGRPVARRHRDVVGLTGERRHASFERQTRGSPRRGSAAQHLDRPAGAQLGRGIAGDVVLAGQHLALPPAISPAPRRGGRGSARTGATGQALGSLVPAFCGE